MTHGRTFELRDNLERSHLYQQHMLLAVNMNILLSALIVGLKHKPIRSFRVWV
jgi:hypothetical protein